jgi:hypothetical protein
LDFGDETQAPADTPARWIQAAAQTAGGPMPMACYGTLSSIAAGTKIQPLHLPHPRFPVLA